MKVTIEYTQGTQGLLGTKVRFDVTVRTQLTAEEAAAIRHVDILSMPVIEHERNGVPMSCTAVQLINGGAKFTFDNFIQARNFALGVKKQLSNLKGVIDEAIRVKEGHSETFEL
jgi:hypothetical protein